jgi:D-alanyl-D-alanine carboxypeptidase (penicillin-binding protein 5/6)
MAALERENAQPGTVLAEGTRTEGEMVGAVPEGEAGLALTAPSAVLLEGSTGTVLFEKEKDEERMIASVTKVMTMLLIFEALDSGKIALSDPVTVSAHAASMGGSQVYLEENEVQTVETMIKCICIASANDAATAMAEHIAGSEEAFVEKMNQRAGELGMEHTHFLNCCGLDDDIASGHYSSAYDVALMSRELIMNHPQIKDYSTVWMDSFVHSTRRGEKEFGLTNTNRLVRTYEGITGLKTGSTSKAKYCLSATAQRNGVDMIAVVLGAATPSDRFGEASSLLNYGFANTQVYRDLAEEHGFETVEIKKGVKDTVSLGMEKDFSHVFTKGEDITAVSSQAIFAGDIQAPVKKGDVLGSVEYFYEGEKLGAAALLAQEDIGKAGFLFCFGKILKRYAGIGEEKAEGEA